MTTSIFAFLFVIFLFFFAIGVSYWTKNTSSVRDDSESFKKWRESPQIYKNHWISIMPYFDSKPGGGIKGWEVRHIYNLETKLTEHNLGKYDTYEQAWLAGIKEVDNILRA